MRLPRLLFWTMAIFILSFWGLGVGGLSPSCAAELIRINGSGSALDMMKPIAAAFVAHHPDVHVVIERPLGSSGAIKALLAGALDLVVSSKQLTAEQAQEGAKAREYGRTPFAVVTEHSIPQSNVTTEELEAIYAGKLTTWPNGERIRVVLRPETDIDTAILKGLSPGLSSAIDAARHHHGIITALTDPESNETVAKTPGGIGASGLSGVLVEKLPLKVLSLNGVQPTVKALADRTYPLAKEIRFITMQSKSSSVEQLLTFVYSSEGREIAEKAGVLVTAGTPTEP